MRIVIFAHSLISDWNHGNAHFLRGIVAELIERSHDVRVFEPHDGWSLKNLIAEEGKEAVEEFERTYPSLRSSFYHDIRSIDTSGALSDADIVIVHEWSSHELVRAIGERRSRYPTFRLFFHDTHHRSVTDCEAMSRYDLKSYDGVLAYGTVIRDFYREQGWCGRAWTWHEAADTRIFYPRPAQRKRGDLVWIGNWGDDERSEEIREFLIEPVKALKLKACVYGVRYPKQALAELASAGIEYGGWLPNHRVPEIFSQYCVTVHIPRRPYARALPGIPTIRPFEALACGIPLISAPWQDTEELFRPGVDYLRARDGEEMTHHLRNVLSDQDLSAALARHGLTTIRARHTCAHRVDELMSIVDSVEEGELVGGAVQ